MSRYQVLTFGESMMRLTPPGFLRIEQTRTFDIWVGGTESNTAVGLARLGHESRLAVPSASDADGSLHQQSHRAIRR